MNDFRNQLSDFAEQIEITEGSASSAAAKARRRTRASVAARVGVVAVVAAAGVVGVQALSTPGLEGEPIDAPNGVASSDSTTPAGSTAPPEPAATVAPVAGDGSGEATDAWLASAPQTRPAEYSDLNYTWTAYPADSPEALALRFDPNQKYGVGTTDGRRSPSDEAYYFDPFALYEKTSEGWNVVERLDEHLYVSSYAVVGDTIYLVVGDPIDAGADHGAQLRAYDFNTSAWREVAMPESARPPLPAGSALDTFYSTSIAERDGTLVVLAETYYEIDASKLGTDYEFVSRDPNHSVQIEDLQCMERVEAEMGDIVTDTTVLTDPFGETTAAPVGAQTQSSSLPAPPSMPGSTAPLQPAMTTTTGPEATTTQPVSASTVGPVDVTGDGSGAPYSVAPNGMTDPKDDCFRTVSFDELGLSAADQELLAGPTYSLWSYDGTNWTQGELPGAGSSQLQLSHGGVVSASELRYVPEGNYFYQGPTSFFETLADGAVRPLFDGHQFADGGSARDGSPAAPGRVISGSSSYVLNQELQGGQWTATDLNALGDQAGWGRFNVDSVNPEYAGPDGGVIAIGNIESPLPSEETEFTSGQYTLRFPTNVADEALLIDNATGEAVPYSYLSTESGRITMSREQGEGGPETVIAEFEADWTEIPYLNVRVQTALFVSDDGVHFGVVDGAKLAEATGVGVDVNIEFSEPTRRDGQLIVKGAASGPSGDSEHYIFVGTPN